MVHGPKWQNSNKIIAGKPADATRANAIPINVGSKKFPVEFFLIKKNSHDGCGCGCG